MTAISPMEYQEVDLLPDAEQRDLLPNAEKREELGANDFNHFNYCTCPEPEPCV